MATADEMEQVSEESSFEAGLRRWAQSRPPLDFNTWQQGFSQIRQLFLDRGLDAPRPGSDYTAVVSALRDEYMQEIYGPFWKNQLSTSKTLLKPSSKSMLVKRGDAATSSGAPAAGSAPAAAADGSGSVPPALPEADGLGGVVRPESGLELLDYPAQRGPASAGGRLEGKRVSPYEFVVRAARRGPASVAASQMGSRRGLPPMRTLLEMQAMGRATPAGSRPGGEHLLSPSPV